MGPRPAHAAYLALVPCALQPSWPARTAPAQPSSPESPGHSSSPGTLLGLTGLQGIFSPHPCLVSLPCLRGADGGCADHNANPELHAAGHISDLRLEPVKKKTCQRPACPCLSSWALLHVHYPWLGTGGAASPADGTVTTSSADKENQEEAPFWAELSDEVSPLPRPALAGHRGLAAAETITTSIFPGD